MNDMTDLGKISLNFIKELKLENFTTEAASYRIPNESDRLKKLLLDGIDAQFEIIQQDINKKPTKYLKRWYKKQGCQYLVFIKYQNKPIPYLDNDNTAIVANSLEEVFKIYQGIQKELRMNPHFIDLLLSKIKNMKIAKGKKEV